MNRKTIFVLILLLSSSVNYSFSQSSYYKKIQLTSDCMWESKKRVVLDSIENQIATIIVKKRSRLLLIKNKEYYVCNMPIGLTHSKLLVSGYVLSGLSTEKLIATPLKLTSAYSQ